MHTCTALVPSESEAELEVVDKVWLSPSGIKRPKQSSSNPTRSHVLIPQPFDPPTPKLLIHDLGKGSRTKRVLSIGEQPQPKRSQTSKSSTSQTYCKDNIEAPMTPAAWVGSADKMPTFELEGPNTPTQSQPSIEANPLSLSLHSPSPLIPSLTAVETLLVAEVAPSGLLPMSLGSDQPGHQPNFKSTESKADILLQALQTLRADPLAEFKSKYQQDLLESVFSRQHTVGVLPTGGGKSLAYELPPVCLGQLTFAVFPFRVLLDQAEQTCKNRGISFTRWAKSTHREISNARLVIMSIETLLTGEILE